MIKHIKKLTAFRSGFEQHKQNLWEIWIDPQGVVLWIPYHTKKIEDYDTWAKMLSRIISCLRQDWTDTHTFIRLDTYYVPEQLIDLLEPDQIKEVTVSNKDDHIYLLPDCNDQHVWETVFKAGTLVDCGRTVFILDHVPLDWHKTIDRLFEIAQALTQGYSIDVYESDLSSCRCLCYSVDENLVIAKADLSEDAILSILRDIAKEKNLELLVHRQDENV